PVINNTRYEKKTFIAQQNSVLHGFVGYFDVVLYEDVTLSIVPRAHSPGMLSWFPIFFPIKEPIQIKCGNEIEVHFWRRCSAKNVWYEWCINKPLPLGIHNPNERWFTEKHEWIEVNGKIGTVGISNYAQDALGDVVYAQLPDVGSSIKKEEEVGALESVKAASEIISPISGTVVEKNEAVENKPGLINTSCYKDGWLFKVEIANLEEVKSLMNEKSYEDFLKTDPH
ncbi:hypothetical protein PV326_009287, partial [Microctonus aethiopoides]